MSPQNEAESKLGFDQIRFRLKSFCLSTPGSTLVDKIHFSNEPVQVLEWLHQNLEFLQILERGEAFPSDHYHDPTEWFAKAAVEGTWLEAEDFLQLAFSLQTILQALSFVQKNRDACPHLFKLSIPVTLTRSLPVGILDTVDDRGFVKDSASTELSRIRKKLRDEQGRLRKLIDQMYRQALEQKWIPEGALPTIRSGRLVLPILADHKRRLKGFIHDESATGQTVFLEPAEALEANNEIRDLEHEEKREVIRILTRLTDMLRAGLPQLHVAFDFLAWMDFSRARAKLSVELEAAMPEVVHKPALRWMNARHPLLYLSLKSKRGLVPLTIELTEADRMLLVSGPNAGGKSVCLKTVGLLQYMLQCGLLVPSSPDSTYGIFDQIFIDIGDQQSIENDLSTYSSHLKNMAGFIRSGTSRSLVLMDELGSGTDPNFGGAIAQAVLMSLMQNGCWCVATTHYYNLKLFANHQAGIQNAAMRFDEEKLVPLYILDIGKPGSSYALEIAEKTGLPGNTLEEAKKLAGSELVGIEKLRRELERERVLLSEKLSKLDEQNAELKSLVSHYENLSADVEGRRKQILEKAREEARALLNETNRQIEKTIRHIRENQAQRSETLKARKNIQELTKRLTQDTSEAEPMETGPVKVGERVRMAGQEGSGVVLSVKGKWAIVQFGELTSKMEVHKLHKAGQSKETNVVHKQKSTGVSLHEKRATYTGVLDVRGKRVDEVVPLLDQFIDTSVLLGQSEVKILHGKGEGVLRKVIREQLRKHKQVASVTNEHVEWGGDGITVVVLK